MTTANDSDIQAFLSIEARHAVAVAPSFDEAVGRLAPRVAGRPRHGSQRLIVLTAATLLLVAMLTAKDEPHEIAKGLALGADAYVTKPYSKSVLADTIGRILKVR